MSEQIYTTIREILALNPSNRPWKDSLNAYFRFLDHRPGEWVALQALFAKEYRGSGEYRKAGSYTAFVDSADVAASLCQEMDCQAPMGLFVLHGRLDQTRPDGEHRRVWILAEKGESLTDKDFVARRAAFIDLDPKRRSGISATKAESNLAILRASEVWNKLVELLGEILPEGTAPTAPLAFAYSGNGCQIHVALDDLPANDETRDLTKSFLEALARVYDDEKVEVDQKVFDAKRLAPCFGTVKRKGADDPASDRRHRRSWFVSAAETTYRLSEPQFRQLVAAVEALAPLSDPEDMIEDVTPGVTAPVHKTPTGGNNGDNLRKANELGIQQVAEWLGLVEGDAIRCPGCGETNGVNVHPKNPNLLHCFHNRCSKRPNKTPIDLVMASRKLDGKEGLKEAYKLLAERFNLPPLRAPGRPRKSKATPPPGAAGADWESSLTVTDKGEIRSNEANAQTILYHLWKGVVCWDERAHEVQYAAEPPKWDEVDAPAKMPVPGDRWDPDTDDSRLQRWLQRNWGVSISTSAAYQSIVLLAKKRSVNPLADWLRSLKWDGKKRIGTWLSDYCQAEDTDYTRLAGRWWLISAVARALNPGCKVDSFLILENRKQGIKKSLTFETLAGSEWFSDSEIAVGEKDGYVRLASRVWIHELGELASLSRVEQTKSRAFFTSRKDRYRPPYGKAEQEIPRHAVFCGTTNDSAYLKDDSGNRRYWPVKVHGTDIEKLAADREQLWAEAVAEFLAGDRWWPETDEERELFSDQQDLRRASHPWEAPIASYLSTRDEVSLDEILTDCLGIPVERQTRGDQTTAGAIVANTMAWEPRRKTVGGRKVTLYVRGADSSPKVVVTEEEEVTAEEIESLMVRAVPTKSQEPDPQKWARIRVLGDALVEIEFADGPKKVAATLERVRDLYEVEEFGGTPYLRLSA